MGKGHFADAIRLPSAKFPTIGDHVAGVVSEVTTGPVPDFDDKGKIKGFKFGEDGVALEQVEVTLDTDNGRVMLHTDGAIFYAIGRALAEIGAEDLDVGDSLTVTYTGDGEPSAKNRNAPKQYKAEIVKG
jgi:hypothetical protein